MLVQYIKRGAYITFFYTMSTVIVRAFNFIMLPYFLSHLTLAEFGIWDFYQLFFSTGTLLVTSCASTSLFRFYVLYKDDTVKQLQSIGNSFLFVLCSVVVMLLCGYLLFVSGFVHSFFSEYACITLVSVSFFALYSMILSLLRVQEKLLLYSTVFCGQNFLALAGTLIGVHYNLGIKSFFYANVASFIIFAPWFFILFLRNRFFSFEVFKRQILFSGPLLLYNLIYMSFFIFDKLFIKNFMGYESLGLYGILWRFGVVFQMIAIAMIDAWSLIIYNAQKEDNANYLISRLIHYYALALTTFCFYSTIGALFMVLFVFPDKYHYIIYYIPLFFFPLFFIEIARLFQTAFGLSTRTFYLPLITSTILIIQCVLLYFSVGCGIWGVFMANGVSFMLYALFCYLISMKVYSYQLINKEKMCKIFIFIISSLLAMHYVQYYMAQSLLLLMLIGLLWPLYVYVFDIIDMDEKAWLVSKISSWYYIAMKGWRIKKTFVVKKNN